MNQFYMNQFKEYYDYEANNKRIWDKYIKDNPNMFILKDFERIVNK